MLKFFDSLYPPTIKKLMNNFVFIITVQERFKNHFCIIVGWFSEFFETKNYIASIEWIIKIINCSTI
jgi:hypothetical protein